MHLTMSIAHPYCGVRILFDDSFDQSKLMVRLVGAEKMVSSGLVCARKIEYIWFDGSPDNSHGIYALICMCEKCEMSRLYTQTVESRAVFCLSRIRNSAPTLFIHLSNMMTLRRLLIAGSLATAWHVRQQLDNRPSAFQCLATVCQKLGLAFCILFVSCLYLVLVVFSMKSTQFGSVVASAIFIWMN